MESYIKVINDNIQEQIQRPRKSRCDNLTKEERKALVSLRSGSDIAIKKADKGSATVVMLREQYTDEVMRQLNNHHLRKTARGSKQTFLRGNKGLFGRYGQSSFY